MKLLLFWCMAWVSGTPPSKPLETWEIEKVEAFLIDHSNRNRKEESVIIDAILRKKKTSYLDRGSTLEKGKSDHQVLSDPTTLIPPKPESLDTSFIVRQAIEIRNAIVSKAEGEANVSRHHEQMFDSATQNSISRVKAEENAIRSHLEMNATEEKDLLEHQKQVQKSVAQTKVFFSMDWNRLEQAKFWSLIVFALVAIAFGITTIYRSLATNNISYLDAHPFALILVSSVFTIPVWALKSRYDALKKTKAKDQYIHRLHQCTIGSFILFVLIFCLVNLPAQQTTSMFEDASTGFADSGFVNYMSLFSQITLECFTSSALIIYATREFENHVIQSDTQKLNTLTKEYESLTQSIEEVRRGRILLHRRLELLPDFLKQVALDRNIYTTKAVTELQHHLRRKK